MRMNRNTVAIKEKKRKRKNATRKVTPRVVVRKEKRRTQKETKGKSN